MGSMPQSLEEVDVQVGSHWEQKLRGHERAGASGEGTGLGRSG